VGEIAYEVELSANNYLRLRIETARPSEVVDFTAQYEAVIEGQTYPVVRYDCAHGFAHRDLLDHDGRNIEKWPLGPMGYKEALQYAITDLKANWRQYRRDFEGRMQR
jgi:hypothetical protein